MPHIFIYLSFLVSLSPSCSDSHPRLDRNKRFDKNNGLINSKGSLDAARDTGTHVGINNQIEPDQQIEPEKQTEPNSGKNTCVDSVWKPSPETKCAGELLKQTSNCQRIREVKGENVTESCQKEKAKLDIFKRETSNYCALDLEKNLLCGGQKTEGQVGNGTTTYASKLVTILRVKQRLNSFHNRNISNEMITSPKTLRTLSLSDEKTGSSQIASMVSKPV